MRKNIEALDIEKIKGIWLHNKADRTITSYDNYLNEFLTFLDNRELSILEVTAEIADEYIISLDGSPATQKLHVGALSSFFSTLVRYKKIDINPFSGTSKLPKLSRSKELIIPTEEDVNIISNYLRGRIRNSSGKDNVGAKKLYCAFHLLKEYGFRINALSTLRVSADRYEGYSKGKTITGKFNSRSYDMLKSHGVEFSDFNSNTLQNMFKKVFTKMVEEGKIKHVFSCHNFRHYFAVKEYMKEKDIYAVSVKLNHSSVSITQNYLESLDIF